MTDAVREGARRAVSADTSPAPWTRCTPPMWRYLEQAGYDPAYASMGVCNAPTRAAARRPPGRGIALEDPASSMTVALTFPYRIFVLGNGRSP